MWKALLLAAVAVAAASARKASELSLTSTVGSKINFGNAVFEGYCKQDIKPAYTGITETDDSQIPAGHYAGKPKTIKVHLKNVALSCGGLLGTEPCAAPAKYGFPRFVCRFTDEDDANTYYESAEVQAYREEDASFGTSAYLLCDIPTDLPNLDHGLIVTIRHGRTKQVWLDYLGETDMRTIGVLATPAPTATPTQTPTDRMCGDGTQPAFSYEQYASNTCPPGWSCSGAASVYHAPGRNSAGCNSVKGGSCGQFFEIGSDGSTGSATSSTFKVPAGKSQLRWERAGGADDGGVRIYLDKTNEKICERKNGRDTDTTFHESCNISAYQGECIHLYLWDHQSSGWGKTYIDNFEWL